MAQKKIQVNGLIPGQKYAVRIKSVASDGATSGWSPSVPFATIKDITPPSTPATASVDFTTSTLIAAWDTVTPKQSSDFKNFKVTVSAPSAGSVIYYTDSPLAFSFDENIKVFGTPQPYLFLDIRSQDNYGNISDPYTASARNPSPIENVNLTVNAIVKGFSASWTAPTASFTDYSYTEVYFGNAELFNASAGTLAWRGRGTYAEYSSLVSFSPIYIKARHFDVFGQAGTESASGLIVTPIEPVAVDVSPPINAASLAISASNDGGATSFTGTVLATWPQSLDATTRGYRLRFKSVEDQFYQYENTASSITSYQINGLIPGFLYEFGIAAYDQYNNTSSYTLSTPSAIAIPYGTAPSQIMTASAGSGQSIVEFDSIITASMIGQIITGQGIAAGTRISGSITGTNASATITPNTLATFKGASITLYPGIAIWQSYITAGTSGSYMKFGTGVNGTQHGIYMDRNNYWYTSGNLRVGSDSSSLKFEGGNLTLSGNIIAQGGSFTGNVQVNQGSIYAGNNPTSGARVIFNASGVAGYNSSGSTGFLLDAQTGNLYASSAYIAGSITFTAGYVGGWTVDTTSIYNSLVGLYAPSSPALTEIAIFAGSALANRALAPFRVKYDGSASFTNVYINGSVTATSGSIGGFSITGTSLYGGQGSGSYAGIIPGSPKTFFAGATDGGGAGALFYVTNTGSFNTTTGSIGRWIINDTLISGDATASMVGGVIATSKSTSTKRIVIDGISSALSTSIFFYTGKINEVAPATIGNTRLATADYDALNLYGPRMPGGFNAASFSLGSASSVDGVNVWFALESPLYGKITAGNASLTNSITMGDPSGINDMTYTATTVGAGHWFRNAPVDIEKTLSINSSPSTNSTKFNSDGTVSGTGNSWANTLTSSSRYNSGSWVTATGTGAPAFSTTCYYRQIGSLVMAKYSINVNSASTATANTFAIRLPIDSGSVLQGAMGTVILTKNGVTPYTGTAYWQTTNSVRVYYYVGNATGQVSTWTNNVPAGQSTSDNLRLTLFYEM